MRDLGQTLLTFGAILLFGLATDTLGRLTKLPRVTLLILFGLLIGSGGFNLVPGFVEHWFPMITDLALLMVGFLLGEKMAYSFLRKNAGSVFWVSCGEVVLTAVIVGGVLFLMGLPIEAALILAGVAPATDPAATTEVIRETNAKGTFTRTLLAIVAIDDAWGLIIFSILLAMAQSLAGEGGNLAILLNGARELGGAILVGLVLGVPMAYLTGRIRTGEPTLIEALGMVLLCGGIALRLNVSFILSAMVMGGVVANLACHHERPFHAIEGIEWPFMILFFVLAGASFELGSLSQIGFIGLAYILLRVLGQVLGAGAGAAISRSDPAVKKWTGMALMPQAGVAVGMTLLATQQFPQYRNVLLPIVLGSTILFELVGPVFTRKALILAGEAP